MRFQIEQKDLIHHIQHLASIVPSKNTTPILTNYLLEANADTDTLIITASDLEITVIAEFNASVFESGITTISARSFNEIINSLPEAKIDIAKQDDILKIHCSNTDFRLLCADHTLFPLVPERQMKNAIFCANSIFYRMMTKTSFAVSSDINRAVLNGVCWMISYDHQIMAATDGRKVAEIKYNQALNRANEEPAKAKPKSKGKKDGEPDSTEENPYGPDIDFEQGIEKILPLKTLSFLQKIHSPEIQDVTAVIEPNRVMFQYGEYTIFTHVIEHKYPDYQKAFIKDLPNILIIDKNALITSIRRVALMAPEDNLRIRFELSNERFEINTTNRDTGEAKELIDKYTYTGSNTSIAFNNKYMIAILESIDTENVQICLGTQKDPIMIYNEKEPENQEITYLLMPLRS